MRSLAATFQSAEPIFTDPRPQEDARLRRLAHLFGIAGVRLSHAESKVTVAAVGSMTQNLPQLEAEARSAEQPLVIADTASAGARFYAGLLLPAAAGCPPLLLSLFDDQPRSPQQAERMAALALDIFVRATVSRQNQMIKTQAERIAALQAEDLLRLQLFDRASATAKIGVWQCDLADNSIIWTNSVYDIFDIPHDAPITRELSLTHYTDASRLQMEAARAKAIREGSDFALDVEIITGSGKHRWMRLTGAVDIQDGVAKRIFGMKQDITDEKLMADQMRYLAECDVMTGLANRSLFQARLAQLDAARATIGALLLVDLDGFKQINDTYGHALGDECLKEAALRLRASCGSADLVARIGGDEFAVLLGPNMTSDEVETVANSIVSMIGGPFLWQGRQLSLGASVGVAHYRSGSSAALFRQADAALYAAKAAGRNTWRSFA